MAYTIVINELQREVILAALTKQAQPGKAVFDNTPEDECKYLREAFAELPTIEKELPGIIHGMAL